LGTQSIWDLAPSRRVSRRFTPVPYTTLFRSVEDTRAGRYPVRDEGEVGTQAVAHASLPMRRAIRSTTASCAATSSGSPGASGAKDRKSTRLNSSHVKISYAVFCLKKKIMKER